MNLKFSGEEVVERLRQIVDESIIAIDAFSKAVEGDAVSSVLDNFDWINEAIPLQTNLYLEEDVPLTTLVETENTILSKVVIRKD